MTCAEGLHFSAFHSKCSNASYFSSKGRTSQKRTTSLEGTKGLFPLRPFLYTLNRHSVLEVLIYCCLDFTNSLVFTDLLKPKMKNLIGDVTTTRWYRLGLELGIDEEDMDIIEDVCKSDTEEALRRTFMLWLKTKRPTWRKMIKALVNIGESNCAHKLMQKYMY